MPKASPPKTSVVSTISVTVTGRNGQTQACTAMGRVYKRLFQNNAIHPVACDLCFWDQPASGQIAELLGNCPLLEMVLMQLSTLDLWGELKLIQYGCLHGGVGQGFFCTWGSAGSLVDMGQAR